MFRIVCLCARASLNCGFSLGRRSRLPASVDGFSMTFKVTSPSGDAAKNPDKFLPTSQVCFFKLTLPKYTSEAVLREKLLYAISNALTMQLDFRMDSGDGFEDLEAAAAGRK